MKTWTLDELMAERPCYTREQLAVHFNGGPLTLAQILDRADVAAADRMWVVWRPSSLMPEQRQQICERIVTRAIKAYALPCPQTKTWAEKWLSGEDRSEAAAGAAAGAAWAGAAAWAAGAGAWAAAWAAGAARAEAACAARAEAACAARAEAEAAEYQNQIEDVKAVLALELIESGQQNPV